MKEFARNEVAGFQASVLLKVNFCTFIFQNFINCLKTPIPETHFYGCFNLFMLFIY